MKFVMAEKLHEKYLEDVVKAIGQDRLWKKKVFAAKGFSHLVRYSGNR